MCPAEGKLDKLENIRKREQEKNTKEERVLNSLAINCCHLATSFQTFSKDRPLFPIWGITVKGANTTTISILRELHLVQSIVKK